jgi:peptidase YpeB-like protein
MLRKTMILVPAALLGVVPLAASAETMDASELEMFRSAPLTLQQAGEAALLAHPGTLAAISFGDEDGRAAYEATVVGADGHPLTVLVDAKNGEILAAAAATDMEDHKDGVQDSDGDGDNDEEGESDGD